MNSDYTHWWGQGQGSQKRDTELRIGDAERDQVTTALHDHFAAGRLSRDELDERLDSTLSAKTRGDLRKVTWDLPGEALTTPPQQMPDPAMMGPPRMRPKIFVPVFPLIVLGIILLSAAHGGAALLIPFLVGRVLLVFLIVALVSGFFRAGRRRRAYRRHDGGRNGPGMGGSPPWQDPRL
jgi:hypothetical protein